MTTYAPKAPRIAKQAWNENDVVSVGFIKGLVVKSKIATPGDHRPDFYVLWQPATNRWYSFQPNYGLQRRDSREDAELCA